MENSLGVVRESLKAVEKTWMLSQRTLWCLLTPALPGPLPKSTETFDTSQESLKALEVTRSHGEVTRTEGVAPAKLGVYLVQLAIPCLAPDFPPVAG